MVNQVTDEKYVLNLSDISAVKTCKENATLNIGSVYSVTYGEIAYCKATVSDGGVTSVTSYAPATEADVIDALNSIKNDNPDVYKNEMDKLSSLKENAQWNRKYPQSDRDPVRFAYDFATSKFSEDEVGHDMTLVESKCVYSETCGQYDKLVYHCSECNQDFTVYEMKRHENLVDGGVEFEEDRNCAHGVIIYQDCEDCGEKNVSYVTSYGHSNNQTEEEISLSEIVSENPSYTICSDCAGLKLKLYSCKICDLYVYAELVDSEGNVIGSDDSIQWKNHPDCDVHIEIEYNQDYYYTIQVWHENALLTSYDVYNR